MNRSNTKPVFPNVSKRWYLVGRIATDSAPQALECGVPPDVVLRLGSSALISAALVPEDRHVVIQ